MATGDVGLGGYPISLLEMGHIFPHFDHLSGILVAEEERKLHPG
jgi:hypothetical protein